MYSEIKDIVAAGATVNIDHDAGAAIVTWWVLKLLCVCWLKKF